MKSSINIIGINWQCNSSACLMIDGEIIGSVSEERFSKVKNDERYPKKAIEWLLKEFKIKPTEINAVCYISNLWSPSPILLRHYTKYKIKDYVNEQKYYWKEKIYNKNNQSILKLFYNKIDFNQYPGKKFWKKIYHLLKNTDDHISNKKIEILGKKIRSEVIFKHLKINKNKIHFIDHPSGHAAWAFFSSSIKNKKNYLVLTLDAFGDYKNYTISRFPKENKIQYLIKGDNSIIARLYRYTTLLLGFKPDEHEYKLMGMAPYAKEKYFKDLFKVFKKFQIVKGIKFVNKKMPKDLYFDIQNIFEGFRFDSICGALQNLTELLSYKWVTNISKKFNIKNFMLVGGVAMNVKNNLNLTKINKINNLFVPLSPDDSSLSMGAAYYYNSIVLKNKSKPIKDGYLGPKINFIHNKKLNKKFIHKYKNINEVTAELLTKGKIVGRIYGRAEFGARALGNRSLIANPTNYESLKKINSAIKSRDFWMPFAASVIESKAKKYFKIKDNIGNYSFMTKCVETTPEGENLFKSAIHPYDKTCRPHIILKNSNPNYEDLIMRFGKKTNTYGLLNTSFNLHGFPIVNDAKDVFKIFEKSNLDALIINNDLYIKPNI